MATILMTEDFWKNSQFSAARHYGGMQANFGEGSHIFEIVNKNGTTLFELSTPGSPDYVGRDSMAIPPGEPADLVDVEFIPFYKKLGRKRFIEVLLEHEKQSRSELLEIYESETNSKRKEADHAAHT